MEFVAYDRNYRDIAVVARPNQLGRLDSSFRAGDKETVIGAADENVMQPAFIHQAGRSSRSGLPSIRPADSGS